MTTPWIKIKDKEDAKILGLDTVRMLGFNLLAIIITSIVIYAAVFGYEIWGFFAGGTEAYGLEHYGREHVAFYQVFYDIVDLTVERTAVPITYSSYAVMLLFNAMYIRYRRKQFTYDNMEHDWEKKKMTYFRNNLIGYFVISLPTNIYFLVKGIKGVYHTLHVVNILTQKKGLGVPDWISTLFGPQTAFYRLTQSVILGLILNLAIFYGVTAAMYLIKKKETVQSIAEATDK